MILIFRLLVRLLQFLLVCVPLMLLGIVVLAIVLPFIPAGVETLPKALAWFDNYSGRTTPYPTGDGLSGDPAYRKLRLLEGHTSLFWERFYWLALRNPINYFDYTVLGHKFTAPAAVLLVLDGNADVSDRPPQPGFKHLEIKDGSTLLYEYYYVSKSYTLFGNIYEFKLRFGWKLGGLFEAIPGTITQWVFDINPLQRSV